MHPPGGLLTVLTVLCVAPIVSPEKLSVLLPNQNQQFDLDHGPAFDQPSRGVTTGLSPPQGLPLPPVSQFPLAAPPAPVPIGPPASPHTPLDIRNTLSGQDDTLQDRVPPISALYDVPEVEVGPEETNQGTCDAQTVVVTSRDVIVSTVVSQVTVPTTVLQRVTTTRVQLQTALQTSYVTLPPFVETRTLAPETVYLTTTRVQRQVITSTQYVTTRVTELAYTTITRTNLRYETAYSTRFQPTYITTTATQYVTRPCPPLLVPTPAPTTGYDYSAPTAAGYNYPSPTTTSSVYAVPGGNGGHYGSPSEGYQGPVYGPYYHASYFQPLQSRRNGLFGGWKFAG